MERSHAEVPEPKQKKPNLTGKFDLTDTPVEEPGQKEIELSEEDLLSDDEKEKPPSREEKKG